MNSPAVVERVNHPRTVSCPQITAPAIPLPSTRALPSIRAPAPVPVGTVVPVEQVGHDPDVGEGTWMKSFTFGGAAPLPFQKGRSAPSGGDPNAPEATQEPLGGSRSGEHTSELQSRFDLVCRLLLEKTNHGF